MEVTIDEILNKPFLARPYEKKLEIVLEGKPRPFLPDLFSMLKKKRKYKHHFYADLYSSVDWLSACDKRNKLFCWPCILFSAQKSQWNGNGYDYCHKHLKYSIKEHEKSIRHVQSVLDFHMFSKNIKVPFIRNSVNDSDIRKYNDLVRRNRRNLKRIIDAICYLVSKDYKRTDKLLEHCLGVLNQIQSHLPFEFGENEIDLLHKSPNYFVELIHSIKNAITNAIKNEVREVSYVSIILNETSVTNSHSQVATMLRYVKNSKIYERCLGFANITKDKSSDIVFKHILSVIDEYKLSEKLVSQSYGESIISVKHLRKLIQMVRIRKMALFVPCYFHDFERLLQRGMSHIEDCKVFFKMLDGIGTYFSENSERWLDFENFLVEKLPGYRNTEYCIKSEVIDSLGERRMLLFKYFDSLIKNPDKWDADEIMKARVYSEFLQRFSTVFMLETFSNLFAFTKPVQLALKSEMPEIVFNSEQIQEVKLNILNFKECGFELMFQTVVKETLNLYKSMEKEVELDLSEETKFQFFQLFNRITKCMVQLVEVRCDSLPELDFFHLLNFQHFNKNWENFPNLQFIRLLTSYDKFFDSVRLQHELQLLYFHYAFSGKTIQEILEFLIQDKLNSHFTEITKLAKLLLTLPCKTAQVNCGSSTMESYSDWSFDPDEQDSFKASWTFLCVEKKLLEMLKRDDKFYEIVVNEFQKQTSDIELIYL